MTHLANLSIEELHRTLLPITVSAASPRRRFTNWSDTFQCTPLSIFEPETRHQCELILELARREGRGVRAAGVGHSPSDLACTTEYMLRTEKMNKVLEINTEKRYAVVEAGILLNDLHIVLGDHGLAMMNVGSISDQTLAGVITTATHGTGMSYSVISTHVLALTLLLADGSHVMCSRHQNANLFTATLCGLGSTGLILTITLEVEAAFRLKEVQQSLPFDHVISRLDQVASSAEHVKLWWFPAADTVRLSLSDRTQQPKRPQGSWLWHSLLGFHVVQFILFLGRYVLSVNSLATRFASWLVRHDTIGVDDGHRIFNVECRYPQYTTEWAIPYINSQACLRELHTWLCTELEDPCGLRPHFPVEVRFSASDDIWLSPSYNQQTCWIGIVQYKPYGLSVPYRRLFERFEAILSKHKGRPHWAKVHQLSRDTLQTLYPRFDDFVQVLEAVDPHGVFRNEYIERHIFGKEVDNRVFKSRQE